MCGANCTPLACWGNSVFIVFAGSELSGLLKNLSQSDRLRTNVNRIEVAEKFPLMLSLSKYSLSLFRHPAVERSTKFSEE